MFCYLGLLCRFNGIPNRVVVIDGSMVWINREVEANMEPYLDAED